MLVSDVVAGGCSDGVVRLWDMRKKELSQSLRTHTAAVTSVMWSAGDAFLASGAASGEIVLHSQTTGVEVARLRKDSQGIKCLQYSTLQEHILAACNEGGSVLVWDTTRRATDVVFTSAHNSPATGLAFSPVNNLLLCSAGLDQRILFYDIKEKKVIKQLESDAPLTSLAFNCDGFTVAAGTLYGDIKVYDLRASAQSRAVLRGHNGDGVNSLEFSKNRASRPSSRTGTQPSRIAEASKTEEDRSALELARVKNVERDVRPPVGLTEPLKPFRTVEEIKIDAKNKLRARERAATVKAEEQPPPIAQVESPDLSLEIRTPPVRKPVTPVFSPSFPEPVNSPSPSPPIILPPPIPAVTSPDSAFSIKQIDTFRSLLESALSSVRQEMKTDNANLHIEIIRQMCIQQVTPT